MNQEPQPIAVTQEMIDFLVAHSPMLRQTTETQGIAAARAKILSESPARIVHEYEERKVDVHFGHLRRADEPNEYVPMEDREEIPFRPKAELPFTYDEWYEKHKHLFENE